MSDTKYIKCRESDVPDNVRFDTPRRHQGQIIEIQYGGFSRYEHDEGDPYKRVIDHSVGGSKTYYRRERGQ